MSVLHVSVTSFRAASSPRRMLGGLGGNHLLGTTPSLCYNCNNWDNGESKIHETRNKFKFASALI